LPEAPAGGRPYARTGGRFLVRRLLFTVFVLDLAGSFITETIFNLPGIGQYAVTSIFRNDFPSVMGVTIFGAFFIAIANLCVDIAYAYVDPRLRFA
jgi:peptide/nickel transport system permease protein